MRRAGRVVAEMHDVTRRALRPGVTTGELDRLAREVLDRRGARSNFLGYAGSFPGVICASPNAVVVHGMPGDETLEDGDIISVDCGAIVDGWHGDAAYTAAVGTIEPEVERLIETTHAALRAGIARLMPGGRLGDLGYAVQSTIEGAGFAVVEGFVGHGIGQAMHEPPDVPNQGRPGRGHHVRENDTFAVEPMACMGVGRTMTASDGWTVRTLDGSWAAHWEHSVVVTPDGPEILTLP